MAARRRDTPRAGHRTRPPGDPTRDLGRLRSDLAADRERLNRHVESLREALVHWSAGNPPPECAALASTAVQGWYGALEDALTRIQATLERPAEHPAKPAAERPARQPAAARTSRELLARALVDVPDVRPAILPRHLEPSLLALLGFSHTCRNTPPEKIGPARLEAESRRLMHIEAAVRRAIVEFEGFLERQGVGAPAGAGERDHRWRTVERPRAHPRYRARLPVRFSISGEGFSTARTADVSALGISVVSDAREGPGGWLDLQIELPNGETVVLEGRVVWARPAPEQARGRYATPGGFGMHLVRPPDEWAHWIEHVAKER